MNRATANILDQQLLGKYRYSLHQLMEVAGLSVAQAIHAEFGTTVSYALVIAGPGNNGGDALVAARHLRHFGYGVHVYYPAMHKLTQPNLSDPQTLYASLVEQCTGLEIPCAPTLSEHTERFDLVVDGLFGFNLDSSRVLSDEYKHALCLLHSTYAATVSIDLPSGWLCELLSESDAEKHNRAMQCGKETDPKCLEWQPTMVVSLSAIKECMVRFKGIEYVGGRFVPPVLAKELGIRIPTYPASAQFVKLHDKRN